MNVTWKNRISWKAYSLILVIGPLWLQACASTQITRKELDSVENIRVVRYKTPNLTVKTLTGVIFDFVGGGAIVPALIASRADKKATEGPHKGSYFRIMGNS